VEAGVRLQFDNLAFDAECRQVWLRGEDVTLSPKAFTLLALLIDQRPRAVSKADIHRHLWPETHVAESSLPSLVSEIREAIGDRRRRPGFVRTLHGFGYAFHAEPTLTAPAAPCLPTAWLLSEHARMALAPGENILGREGDGVIVVKSATVSRRHARIVLDATRGIVEDLGSKNGTFVNEQRVSGPTPVVHGDRIRIGPLLFTFHFAKPSDTTETSVGEPKR
jgi:DNA-binding winged helix-turn-helix (wHTH) protein